MQFAAQIDASQPEPRRIALKHKERLVPGSAAAVSRVASSRRSAGLLRCAAALRDDLIGRVQEVTSGDESALDLFSNAAPGAFGLPEGGALGPFAGSRKGSAAEHGWDDTSQSAAAPATSSIFERRGKLRRPAGCRGASLRCLESR